VVFVVSFSYGAQITISGLGPVYTGHESVVARHNILFALLLPRVAELCKVQNLQRNKTNKGLHLETPGCPQCKQTFRLSIRVFKFTDLGF